MKRVLDFGDAAEVISTGKEREYWIPSIDDMREKDSRDLLTGAAVNQGAAEILAKPGDPTDKERVRDKYLALFEAVYDPLERDDYKRDYDRSIRKLDAYLEQKPKLLSYILSTLSTSAKEKIRAHPKYNTAISERDLLAIWQIIQEKFGSRGIYTCLLYTSPSPRD